MVRGQRFRFFDITVQAVKVNKQECVIEIGAIFLTFQ